jgi:3-oxoadipate enol-lactonase
VALPFDETGAGPAIVLLHAGIADRTMWSEHLEPLAEAGYRAVAVDIPGFGEASVPPGPDAPWNDVLQTMAELRIDRAALVGNSYGGAVALRVAVVAPVAASALALISAPAPGFDPSPELGAAWEAEEAAVERGDFDAAVELVMDTWVPERLRDRVAPMQRRALELQAKAEGVTEAADPAPDIDGLRGIEIPALVAYGERDMVDFREGAEAMADALPDARLEVIEGAGHLSPLEKPEAFRELLLGFLGPHRCASVRTTAGT